MASATELERLVVTLVADADKYTKPLKEAEKATKQTTRTVEKATQDFKESGQKIEATAGHYRDASGRMRDANGRFVAGAKKADAAAKSFNKTLKNSTSIAARASKSLKVAGDRIKSIGASIRSAGASLSLRVTAPLSALGGVAVKSFADFDSAMQQSLAIQQLTTEQMEDMKNLALEMGGQVGQGPIALAEAYFFLASAGLNAEQQMAALPAVTSFSAAGMFDLAQATDLLTDAQSALGLTTADAQSNLENMVRVSDVLVKANTLANASVEQFSTALTSKAGASLKVFNKDVEEGVAVLAAYADQGIKAELAGNALDRTLRLMSAAALNNKEAHQEMGLSIFDANGKMQNMADIVSQLEDITGDMSDAQRGAALDMMGFDSRVQQVILPLLGASDAIRNYEKELRKAGGTTERVANNQAKAFSNQVKILWNQLTIAAIKIGEVLAPAVLWLNGMLQKALALWDNLGSGVKQAIVYAGMFAAAVGPVLIALAGLSGVIGMAITGFSTVLPLILSVGAAMAPFLAIVAGVAVAFVELGAAVIALIGWLYGKDGLVSAWESVTGAIVKAFSMAYHFFANFKHNAQALTSWFVANWDTILLDIGAMFLTFAKNMVLNLQVALYTMVRLTNALMGTISSIIDNLFNVKMVNWVIGGINKSLDALKQFKEIGRKILMGMFTGAVINAFKLSGVKDDFKSGVEDGFLNTAKGIIKDGMDALKGPLDGFEAQTKEMPDLILASLEETTEAAQEATDKAQEKVMGQIKDLEGAMEQDFNVKVKTQGLEALEAGTKAAYERLLQHRAMMAAMQGGEAEPVQANAEPVNAGGIVAGRPARRDGKDHAYQDAVVTHLKAIVSMMDEAMDLRGTPVIIEDAELS